MCGCIGSYRRRFRRKLVFHQNVHRMRRHSPPGFGSTPEKGWFVPCVWVSSVSSPWWWSRLQGAPTTNTERTRCSRSMSAAIPCRCRRTDLRLPRWDRPPAATARPSALAFVLPANLRPLVASEQSLLPIRRSSHAPVICSAIDRSRSRRLRRGATGAAANHHDLCDTVADCDGANADDVHHGGHASLTARARIVRISVSAPR